MSEYTTGELAKLAKISVRTIQYYDKKKLLRPSKILDNGKRIYTDDDLSRLKLILLFKNLGLSLKSIAEILESPNSTAVLNLLLDQQTKALKNQISVSKEQLRMVNEIQRSLPKTSELSLKSIDDIDEVMNNKKSLKKVHLTMIIVGIPMDAIEILTLIWAIQKNDWIPFIIGIFIVILIAIWVSRYYYKNTNYICPNCNSEFKPKFWAAFFGVHTPRARKLVCPVCGKQNYCVEVYDDKN